MKKISKLILLSLALVLVAAGCNQVKQDDATRIVESQRPRVQVSHQVFELDRGDQLFNFYADENKSALDLLKSGHQVETKEFAGVGEFVESIDGKKADGTTEFWAFYVNGEQAQVGASQYHPKDGDRIEWKLEKIE